MESRMADQARRIARGLRRWRRWTRASELQRLIDEASDLLDQIAEQEQQAHVARTGISR